MNSNVGPAVGLMPNAAGAQPAPSPPLANAGSYASPLTVPQAGTSVGLMPGAAGVQQLASTPIATVAPYGSPLTVPQVSSTERLRNQQSVDQLAQTSMQTQMMAIQTASSIRQQIDGGVHTMANQALSTSNEYIGDMVAQAKKMDDNSTKAV